jgi:hypothetical protein
MPSAIAGGGAGVVGIAICAMGIVAFFILLSASQPVITRRPELINRKRARRGRIDW